ncbi:MAG: hypothetical protein IJ837_03690 [Clostridia bacterium]|nr:hypothetical protein [Clostridia bacterium]
MANSSLDFKAFGIKDNLQKLVKRTSILEIITGFYMIVLSLCVFLVLVAIYSPLKNDIFNFFGFKETSSVVLGTSFTILFAVIGAMYLVVGTVSLVSGLKTKSYANNPVTLIEGKKQYITLAISYMVFMVLMILSVYFFIVFPFILFIFLVIIGLLLILTLIFFKFLAIKNVPNKVEVLNVETLSDDKKEAILLNSNNLDEVKKEIEPKKEKVCEKCKAKMPMSAKKCPSCGELVKKVKNK